MLFLSSFLVLFQLLHHFQVIFQLETFIHTQCTHFDTRQLKYPTNLEKSKKKVAWKWRAKLKSTRNIVKNSILKGKSPSYSCCRLYLTCRHFCKWISETRKFSLFRSLMNFQEKLILFSACPKSRNRQFWSRTRTCSRTRRTSTAAPPTGPSSIRAKMPMESRSQLAIFDNLYVGSSSFIHPLLCKIAWKRRRKTGENYKRGSIYKISHHMVSLETRFILRYMQTFSRNG